jgi:hypothetical protein
MKTLQMQDLQNNIERHNFSYIFPRILSKKFNSDQSNQQKTPPKKNRKESSSSKASVLHPVIMPTNSLPKKKLNLMTSYQSVGLGFSSRGREKSQSLNHSPLPPPSSNITHHSEAFSGSTVALQPLTPLPTLLIISLDMRTHPTKRQKKTTLSIQKRPYITHDRHFI